MQDERWMNEYSDCPLGCGVEQAPDRETDDAAAARAVMIYSRLLLISHCTH